LRRTIIIGTAVAVLVGAVAAFAASADFNRDTANDTFSPTKAGSAASPSPNGRHDIWTARGNNGHQAAPLTRVTTKVYGTVVDAKDFPVCTAQMINNAGSQNGSWNKVCPKGSLIGAGPVNSLFVPASAPNGPGTACNPYETVYNAGPGKQTFFFEESPFAPGPQYTCANGAVKTGAAAAYTGTVKVTGGYAIFDQRLPASISTSAGGLSGIYASLVKLNVTYPKLTRKVKGKTVAYTASVACKKGVRPYSVTFTATNYAGQSPSTQTTTVSHSNKC
jgi:hypothetical protein